MKTYITTLILLFSTFCCFAQEDEIVPLTSDIEEEMDKTYYFKDMNGDLNKFLGTWKYQDATKELIVTFFLKTHDEDGLGDYFDLIFARFKYTDNGTVIYNTLNSLASIDELHISGSSFLNQTSGGISVPNTNKMDMFYDEPTDIPYTRSPYQRLEIEYLSCTGLGCSPQLKWDIFWTKQKDLDVWPFKIPSDLTLTKQ